ncbi:MAG: DUF3048 domain-containing protein [Chloroflexia bacterium]
MLGVVIFLATMVAGAALLRGDGTVDTRSARPAPSSAAEGSPTDLPTTPVVAAGVEPTAAVLEPSAATDVKAPTVRTTTPALAAQTAATHAPTQQVVATPAAPTAVPPKPTVAEPTPTPTKEPPRPAPTTARPTRSQVAVVTGEQRAVLVIDGVVRGRTPRAVSLPPGKHEVVVYSRTHERMTRSVNLQAGRRTRLALDMTPRRAKLEVLAGTNKAIVLVDGKRRGRTPLETTVKPGRHTITVQRAGHREWSQYVRFTPAGRKVVRVRLQAKLARFDVSTTPQDAAIYIDNKWRGYTNRVIYGVKPGYHTIVLYKAGRRRIVMRHKFGPDGQITVRSRLVRVAPPGPPRVAVPLRHRPLAVMIENHPNARPQSGLDFADVVLEAPAEFGISRFIAFFMSRDVPVVGPVRSAREYFVLWASEFNPIYFHAGGSPGAASLADRIGLTRTNALWDGRAFYRTNDRYSPHNLYTSTAALLRVERAKGRGLQSGSWEGCGSSRLARPRTRERDVRPARFQQLLLRRVAVGRRSRRVPDVHAGPAAHRAQHRPRSRRPP